MLLPLLLHATLALTPPGPTAKTFEELVDLPVGLEGKRQIPLPARIPRRELRYQTSPLNKGELLKLPWVGREGDTDAGQQMPWGVLLGEMLFHSTRMLGPLNTRMGVSCNHCHPNGATNPMVYTEHSYLVRGRIDLSTSYFSPAGDDGILNAHVIPTLRGVRLTAPYQLDGKVASLREQVRHVVVNEFNVPEPPPYMIDALVMFLNQLDPLANAQLGPRGELSAVANEAAKRGEALFHAPRPELRGQSCASCHLPENGFTDNLTHPLGLQRERYETPTLLGLVNTPPYFHDARATTIEDAVAEVSRLFALQLSAKEAADLAAYLRAIGDEANPFEPQSTAKLAEVPLRFVDLTQSGPYVNDRLVWKLTLETVTQDLDELGVSKAPEENVKKAWSEWLTVANAARRDGPSDAHRKAIRAARAALQAAIAAPSKPSVAKDVP